MKVSTSEKKSGKLGAESLALAVRTFRDAGVVVVEDAIDKGLLKKAQADYDLQLADYLKSKGGLDALEGKTFGKNHIGFFPDMRTIIADETLAANSIAVQVMNELLGANLACSFYHTNTACPGSGIQPVHRDSSHLFGTEMSVAHPVASLVLNIPFCDFTEFNGSTEYWAGSHLIVDRGSEESSKLVERTSALPSSRLNIALGSFALRDLRVWHRGMPNQADYFRTMLAIVYHREFVAEKAIQIPESRWEGWSKVARHIYRKNTVVPDSSYAPATW